MITCRPGRYRTTRANQLGMVSWHSVRGHPMTLNMEESGVKARYKCQELWGTASISVWSKGWDKGALLFDVFCRKEPSSWEKAALPLSPFYSLWALLPHAPSLSSSKFSAELILGHMFGPGTIFRSFAAKLPFHVTHFFKAKHEVVLVRVRPDCRCQELVYYNCSKKLKLGVFLPQCGFLMPLHSMSARRPG